jgi:NAD(P)-dependent dehydrogenase (short-subunit alcohol dehydrogenase family)
MRLEGKVALITGAGSGMGRQMALLFAKEGAKVVAGEWKADTLKETCDMVRAAGGTILGVGGDVSKVDDCAKMVAAAVDTYGKIDILCNNAGIMDLFSGVAEMDDATMDRVFSVNVRGPVNLSRLVIPIMIKAGGGSIVNTASAAGTGGAAAGAAYTMSKHALVGLTKNTAYRYALDGVRCNAMACGGVETNIMDSVDQTKIDMAAMAVLGKWHAVMPAALKPIEIAYLALFLASDEAIHINGAIVPADAGWSAV